MNSEQLDALTLTMTLTLSLTLTATLLMADHEVRMMNREQLAEVLATMAPGRYAAKSLTLMPLRGHG